MKRDFCLLEFYRAYLIPDKDRGEWVKDEKEVRRVHQILGTDWKHAYQSFFVVVDNEHEGPTFHGFMSPEPGPNAIGHAYFWCRTDVEMEDEYKIIHNILQAIDAGDGSTMKRVYELDVEAILDFLLPKTGEPENAEPQKAVSPAKKAA